MQQLSNLFYLIVFNYYFVQEINFLARLCPTKKLKTFIKQRCYFFDVQTFSSAIILRGIH